MHRCAQWKVWFDACKMCAFYALLNGYVEDGNVMILRLCLRQLGLRMNYFYLYFSYLNPNPHYNLV